MSQTEKLYQVKIALKGNIYDTVKLQVKSLDDVPKKHKVLSYKIVNNKSNSK